MFLGVEGFLDADDARVGDGGVGEEDGFEFGGSDLEAGDLDEFLFRKDSLALILPNPVLKWMIYLQSIHNVEPPPLVAESHVATP